MRGVLLRPQLGDNHQGVPESCTLMDPSKRLQMPRSASGQGLQLLAGRGACCTAAWSLQVAMRATTRVSLELRSPVAEEGKDS